MTVFFAEESVKNKLNVFFKGIERRSGSSFEIERNKAILTVINHMINNPEIWDGACEFNISTIGNNLLEMISGFVEDVDKNYIDDIASSLFRFLMEMTFTTYDRNLELESAKRIISNNLEYFSEGAKEQIKYAYREMFVAMMKKIINSDDFKRIKNISSIIDKKERIENKWETMISEKEAEWEEKISEREARVEKIKKSLDEYNTAFNFVGLYDGFNDLFKSKRLERIILLTSLVFLSFLIVSPLIFEFYFIVSHVSNIEEYREALLFSLMPTLSLVVIATYFFRVLLSNYKSVKSQIMQIELRMTLCRFIQSYANYSAELKSKNETTLNKFEEIIFSNILSTDSVDLSAFDGMEKFAGMMGSTKK